MVEELLVLFGVFGLSFFVCMMIFFGVFLCLILILVSEVGIFFGMVMVVWVMCIIFFSFVFLVSGFLSVRFLVSLVLMRLLLV